MVTSQFVSQGADEQHDKRVCQRVELNKTVHITLSNGQHISGITEDLSLGGLRVTVKDATEMEVINTAEAIAMLQIQFADGQLSTKFPCSIVRCEIGSVCLQLDKKKSASFGMMMTRGTFKKKTSNHLF
ncbi:MAG: PilZ domain-containing protein [Gammaproteobacteria bacterium]|nr:PilZ domain-containing protein [Gammaproteobacteria bacterium]